MATASPQRFSCGVFTRAFSSNRPRLLALHVALRHLGKVQLVLRLVFLWLMGNKATQFDSLGKLLVERELRRDDLALRPDRGIEVLEPGQKIRTTQSKLGSRQL